MNKLPRADISRVYDLWQRTVEGYMGRQLSKYKSTLPVLAGLARIVGEFLTSDPFHSILSAKFQVTPPILDVIARPDPETINSICVWDLKTIGICGRVVLTFTALERHQGPLR
jgi:hypothetical protein